MIPTRSEDGALDAVLRPQLVVDPPPEVQARVLAAVLQTVDASRAAQDVAAPLRPVATSATAGPGLTLLAYAMLAVAIGLYAGLLGGLGVASGPVTLTAQLGQAAAVLFGSPLRWVLAELLQYAAGHALWLLLAPLVWYLWDGDRAAARRT